MIAALSNQSHIESITSSARSFILFAHGGVVEGVSRKDVLIPFRMLVWRSRWRSPRETTAAQQCCILAVSPSLPMNPATCATLNPDQITHHDPVSMTMSGIVVSQEFETGGLEEEEMTP